MSTCIMAYALVFGAIGLYAVRLLLIQRRLVRQLAALGGSGGVLPKSESPVSRAA